MREDPNFLCKVVTREESQLFDYIPKIKKQSSVLMTLTSPQTKVDSNMKSIMLIHFFDIYGVVYKELVPAGQTVDNLYYFEIFRSHEGEHEA